jgi:hypothetical protein
MFTLGCLTFVSKVNRKETEKEVEFMKVDSVRELATMIKKDKSLEDEIKKDPAKAIAKITESPLKTDEWIYRIVVSALGLAVLLAVSGGIYLAANEVTAIPEILIAIGSAAVGALAGLLTPTPGRE